MNIRILEAKYLISWPSMIEKTMGTYEESVFDCARPVILMLSYSN